MRPLDWAEKRQNLKAATCVTEDLWPKTNLTAEPTPEPTPTSRCTPPADARPQAQPTSTWLQLLGYPRNPLASLAGTAVFRRLSIYKGDKARL